MCVHCLDYLKFERTTASKQPRITKHNSKLKMFSANEVNTSKVSSDCSLMKVPNNGWSKRKISLTQRGASRGPSGRRKRTRQPCTFVMVKSNSHRLCLCPQNVNDQSRTNSLSKPKQVVSDHRYLVLQRTKGTVLQCCSLQNLQFSGADFISLYCYKNNFFH